MGALDEPVWMIVRPCSFGAHKPCGALSRICGAANAYGRTRAMRQGWCRPP